MRRNRDCQSPGPDPAYASDPPYGCHPCLVTPRGVRVAAVESSRTRRVSLRRPPGRGVEDSAASHPDRLATLASPGLMPSVAPRSGTLDANLSTLPPAPKNRGTTVPADSMMDNGPSRLRVATLPHGPRPRTGRPEPCNETPRWNPAPGVEHGVPLRAVATSASCTVQDSPPGTRCATRLAHHEPVPLRNESTASASCTVQDSRPGRRCLAQCKTRSLGVGVLHSARLAAWASVSCTVQDSGLGTRCVTRLAGHEPGPLRNEPTASASCTVQDSGAWNTVYHLSVPSFGAVTKRTHRVSVLHSARLGAWNPVCHLSCRSRAGAVTKRTHRASLGPGKMAMAREWLRNPPEHLPGRVP